MICPDCGGRGYLLRWAWSVPVDGVEQCHSCETWATALHAARVQVKEQGLDATAVLVDAVRNAERPTLAELVLQDAYHEALLYDAVVAAQVDPDE